MVAEHVLNTAAIAKQGSDTIFSWWARYQSAIASGRPAINGTIGALLEDDGNLAINKVVDAAVRNAPEVEISAYAPLAGLPSFLDLSKTLALGDSRQALEESGFHLSSTATPGGSGALYLAANNLAERGQTVLLRDRHWGPYKGFLTGCGLDWITWPLLPNNDNPKYSYSLSPLSTSLSACFCVAFAFALLCFAFALLCFALRPLVSALHCIALICYALGAFGVI